MHKTNQMKQSTAPKSQDTHTDTDTQATHEVNQQQCDLDLQIQSVLTHHRQHPTDMSALSMMTGQE